MSLYTHEILNSLGWALLHSLWQGGIACAAVIVMRAVWRGDNPSARYLAQCAILLSCFAAFIVTFWIYLQNPVTQMAQDIVVASSGYTLTISSAPDEAAGLINGAQSLAAATLNLNAVLPILGLLWCLGFVFMALRYAGGVYLVRTLRRKGLTRPNAQWCAAFARLAIQSRISRDVKLFISDRVTGPITLGVLKPIVLVPVGFLTALPQDQVEAILLHELAHIRRYDYAFNLVQNAIKAVFFYHPAIHYISRCIDTDREQACDDLAVKKSAGPNALIRALAALPDALHSQKLSLAATGPRHTPILDRMTRLVDPKLKNSNPSASGIFAMALVLTGAAYFSATSQANAASTPKDADVSESQLAGDVPQADSNSLKIEVSPMVPLQVDVPSMAPIKVQVAPIAVPTLPAAPVFPVFSEGGPIENGEFARRIDKISSTWGDFRAEMAQFYIDFSRFETENSSWDGRVEKLRSQAERLDEQVSEDFETHIEAANDHYHDYIDAENEAREAAYEAREDAREMYNDTVRDEIEAAAERRADAKRVSIEARHRVEAAQERRTEARAEARAQAISARAEASASRAEAKAEAYKANKTHTKFDDLRGELTQQLKADGYYNGGLKKNSIVKNNTIWSINGTALTPDQAKPYKKIIGKIVSDLDKFIFADISKDGLHISSHSRNGDERQTRDITIGKFEHTDFTSTKASVATPVPPISPASISLKTHHAHSSEDLPYYTKSGIKITPQFLAPLTSTSVMASHGEYIKDKDEYHSGTDYNAAIGTPVRASLGGTVIFANKYGNWGGLIKIKHIGGLETRYASLGAFKVKVGDKVKAGQIIGTVGTINKVWAPHLHFEIRHDGHNYDPVYVLSKTR
ncbi:M56 family metallopeptidase [Robiginitomaculum antarcticum]|uniref:M56 family metallopeptidase n=1 Tax=Robiginitomaculum antarcticum TaxID=437507 RepID=UPI0003783F70|nr:M56 family metallopeptidase [Robiginitomaculum antarcticum]